MCVPFKGVFAGVSEPEVEVTVFSRLVWLRSDSGEDEAEGTCTYQSPGVWVPLSSCVCVWRPL